ncbi:MAG: hypothetical protein KAT90_09490 [Gammaproteobacteria bacterium]|nr:hypothetical protein [Gammaproteobacteria bacterium]
MDINRTFFTHPTSFIDKLSVINQEGSATSKLKIIHDEIKRHMPFLERIAVIIYQEERDLLQSFIHSDDNRDKVLQFYQSKLNNSESLSEIVHSRTPRVVNDLGIFERNNKKHSRFIAKRNYGASYTTPFYNDGRFTGFIFMNSSDKNVFNEIIFDALSPFVDLIELLVCKEIEQLNTQHDSVTTALGHGKKLAEVSAT